MQIIAILVLFFAFLAPPPANSASSEIGEIHFVDQDANSVTVGILNFKPAGAKRIWPAIYELKKVKGIKEASTLRNDPPLLMDIENFSAKPTQPLQSFINIEKDSSANWDELEQNIVGVLRKLVFSGQVITLDHKAPR